tara:strand:- start:37 stop:633 length:597 start_codon:yes stop_codon:yes gene_type:complete
MSIRAGRAAPNNPTDGSSNRLQQVLRVGLEAHKTTPSGAANSLQAVMYEEAALLMPTKLEFDGFLSAMIYAQEFVRDYTKDFAVASLYKPPNPTPTNEYTSILYLKSNYNFIKAASGFIDTIAAQKSGCEVSHWQQQMKFVQAMRAILAFREKVNRLEKYSPTWYKMPGYTPQATWGSNHGPAPADWGDPMIIGARAA